MCSVYKQKTPTVEGIQFDGENGDAIVEFVGGEDYGKVSGDTVELSLQGKDPRSQKVTVNRGQFVVKSLTATTVVNEGEFTSNFVNEDGSAIGSIPEAPLEEPVPEDQLVYQPGFSPPTKESEEQVAEPAGEEKRW